MEIVLINNNTFIVPRSQQSFPFCIFHFTLNYNFAFSQLRCGAGRLYGWWNFSAKYFPCGLLLLWCFKFQLSLWVRTRSPKSKSNEAFWRMNYSSRKQLDCRFVEIIPDVVRQPFRSFWFRSNDSKALININLRKLNFWFSISIMTSHEN